VRNTICRLQIYIIVCSAVGAGDAGDVAASLSKYFVVKIDYIWVKSNQIWANLRQNLIKFD